MPVVDHQLDQPVFFLPNRVWRCYTGGLLLDRFLGRDESTDGYMPEEWLASITSAENGEHSLSVEEGLSRLRPGDGQPGPLYRDVAGTERMDVLCKFLDAAVRLPIQCHPDQAFARAHYGSEHGKTESWLILDTRTLNGVQPYLLIGFKPGISAAAFTQAVEKQDVAAMEGMLNRIPVSPGDAYLIPGRTPHAIGPGVLMLEVQEPSDWVVQVERRCADTWLSERDMWGPLTPDVAMGCFEYRGETACAVRKRLAMTPKFISTSSTATHERLEAEVRTEAFRIDRLRLSARHRFICDRPRHIGIVTAGSGRMTTGGRSFALTCGETYFASSCVGEIEFVPDPGAPLTMCVIASGSA